MINFLRFFLYKIKFIHYFSYLVRFSYPWFSRSKWSTALSSRKVGYFILLQIPFVQNIVIAYITASYSRVLTNWLMVNSTFSILQIALELIWRWVSFLFIFLVQNFQVINSLVFFKVPMQIWVCKILAFLVNFRFVCNMRSLRKDRILFRFFEPRLNKIVDFELIPKR